MRSHAKCRRHSNCPRRWREASLLSLPLALIGCSSSTVSAGKSKSETPVVPISESERLPVWPLVQNVSWPSRPSGNASVQFLALTRDFEIVSTCGESVALTTALRRHRQQIISRRLPLEPRGVLDGNSSCCLSRLEVCAEDVAAPLAFETVEAYRLSIVETDEGSWVAQLRAPTHVGVHRGLETFSQLVSFDPARGAYGVRGGLPLEVSDAPFFAHRGLLLDCVRHYLPMATIYRTIDAMAMTKMNVLHWHLTDSESLPAESLAKPEMWRAAWSKWEVYTVEDIEDVISYAEARAIRVVPEIDVPGHSKAWAAVFPSLFPSLGCPTKWWAMDPSSNDTFPVLEEVLRDFARRFPGELFHLGGDEVGTSVWNDIRWDCWLNINRTWLAEKRFTSYEEVFGHFMDEVGKVVRAEGKRPVVWDETWRNTPKVPEGAIVQIWEDPKFTPDAIREGHDVIFSPTGAWYLDDMEITWEKMYVLDPLNGVRKADSAKLLGGETALWTEMIDASTVDSMLWPRTAAVAERLWQGSPPGALRDRADRVLRETRQRLAWFRCRLLDRGVGASPLEGIGRNGLKGPSSCFGHREAPLLARQTPQVRKNVGAAKRAKRVKPRAVLNLDEL